MIERPKNFFLVKSLKRQRKLEDNLRHQAVRDWQKLKSISSSIERTTDLQADSGSPMS